MADSAIDDIEQETQIVEAEAKQLAKDDAPPTPETTDDAIDSSQDPLVRAFGSTVKSQTTVPEQVDEPISEKFDPLKTAKDTKKSVSAAPEPDFTQEEQALREESLSDIPEEDWRENKLSHKSKSQFLAQRKYIRGAAKQIESARSKIKEAEERYNQVERFVSDQGLDPDEYASSVTIGGMIKKADPKALRILETTVQDLRKRLNIPDAPATSHSLDPELDAILKESEDYGIDTSKIRAKYQPPAPPTPIPAQQERAQVAPSTTEHDEYRLIIDALTDEGVQDPVSRVRELVATDKTLLEKPAGKRLAAIIKAHAIASQPKQVSVPARQITQQVATTTISGRGRPTLTPASQQTQRDPLKIALKR